MSAARRLPDPPGPPRGVPLARLLAFRRDPLGFLTRSHARYGDLSHARIGPRHFYLVAHPELVREVLVTHQRRFVKSLALQRARVLLGNGLLTSEGDEHLRHRRMIQPAFHRDRIAALAAVMVDSAERTSARWSAGEAVDATREMNRLTLGLAGRALFGTEMEAEADEVAGALTDALHLFDRLTNPLGPLLDRLPVPGTLRMRRARLRLDATIHRIIDGRRREDGPPRDDLLGLLLAARDEEGDGRGLSDGQLRDEVLTLFLAGHETTANALAWTWHLLAAHPAAEARLHAELDGVLEGRPPTGADYPRLPYTRAVLAESMRLRPPAWAFGREPLDDFALGGRRLRRGSVVLVSPWVMHHDARWFPEPERFLPERWTPEMEAALPRLAYLPFGAGARKCIGEHFAWMEGVLVLAALARRWRLRPVEGAEPRALPRITLRPEGLTLRLEPR